MKAISVPSGDQLGKQSTAAASQVKRVVMPVLKALGVDMIWFGVVAVLIIQMGILSPPVGLNVFIVKGIVPDVPMYTIFRGIWPFWYAMGLLIVMLLIFPQLALFLPNTMFR